MASEINRYGEIIRTGNSGNGGHRSNNTNPSGSGFNGWWIVLILLLLFIGYEVVSNLNKSNSQINTADTTKIDSARVSPNPVNVADPAPVTKESIDSTKLTDSIRNNDSLRKADSVVAANAGPYGQGNGKITFYKTCNSCSDLSLTVDGNYLGTLSQVFNESNPPSCDDNGTLSRVFTAGNHTLTGKDDSGDNWNTQFEVKAGECNTYKLWKVNDGVTNPYGSGNGKYTLYKTCNTCPNLKVSIDGEYVGTLTEKVDLANTPTCDDYRTVSKVLNAGPHQLFGVDDWGEKWSTSISVKEGQCVTHGFRKDNDVNPNLNNSSNGTISFWTSNNISYNIYVDGLYRGRLISHFPNNLPMCGQNGTLTITISEGQHSFEARFRNLNWTGQFNASEGLCQLIKVNRN